MGFTYEQNDAIYTRGSNILVAAAAGSGKTAVLVQRIIELITNPQNNVDIDTLLVVTFTEAAAKEMKQRIEAAISKLLETDMTNEHLKKQGLLLNKSSIMTIHSFCLTIIRKYFHLIDIDPSFKIGDETEMKLLKSVVLEELIEEEYLTENNDVFYELIECYGGGKTRDNNLSDLLLKIYDFISSSPSPFAWLDASLEKFLIPNNSSLDETVWAKIIMENTLISLNGALNTIREAIKICNLQNGPIKYMDNFNDDEYIIKYLIQQESFEKLHLVLSEVAFTRLYSYKKTEEVDINYKEKAQKLRDSVKKIVTDLKEKLLFKEISEIRKDIDNSYEKLSCLTTLVKKFSANYTAKKTEKNVLDFNDLEHFAMKILINEDNTPSATALELKEHYNEVYIDEYQDSNYIQEAILSSVSKKDNRFLVGDIKQSIYKFRRANPELFIEKYNDFLNKEDYDNKNQIEQGLINGIKIDLAKNFRSHKNVLQTVNFLFFQLMSEEIGDIDYTKDVALYPQADFPLTDKKVSNQTEICLIDYNTDNQLEDEEEDEEFEDIDKVIAEVRVISKKINDLIVGENKLHTYDKKTMEYRPLKFSDIVILMRSVSSSAKCYVEELKKNNIPAYANISTGFFDSIEIMTATALLRIIDNPMQDIHFVTVLFSPIYKVTSDELLEVKNIANENCYYNSCKKYIEIGQNNIIKEKITAIINHLNKWRDIAVYSPIDQLISIVYDDTFYIEYAGAMEGGTIRKANLHALVEKAIAFENTTLRGLFNFIKYIERIKKLGIDDGDASNISDINNVVNIMTIHKSKGLEFPVVILAGTGKNFNTNDEKNSLVLHQQLGFGPDYYDILNRIKSTTLPKIALKSKIHQENLSEELRVLYVALTRAEDKLIITGCVNKVEKKLSNWNRFLSLQFTKLPTYYMISCKSYMDMILAGYARHKTAGILSEYENTNYGSSYLKDFDVDINLEIIPYSDLISLQNEKLDNYVSLKNQLDILKENKEQYIETENYANLSQILDHKYKYTQNLPTKISISEIKRQSVINEEFENINISTIFKEPDFMKEDKISSVDKGTAIHTLMESLDFKLDYTKVDLIEKINDIVLNGKLEQRLANVIDLQKVINFLNNPLCQRMKNATLIKKETPFVLRIPASTVYKNNEYTEEDTVLVHGIVDCFFVENDKIILVDYKSDYIKNNDTTEIVENYKTQLNIYAYALKLSEGMEVSEKILYLFGIDDFILID